MRTVRAIPGSAVNVPNRAASEARAGAQVVGLDRQQCPRRAARPVDRPGGARERADLRLAPFVTRPAALHEREHAADERQHEQHGDAGDGTA